MLDHLFSWWSHHDATSFNVRGLGLDDPPPEVPLPSIDGPVEYIFKISVSPAIKNGEGILVPTGAKGPTFISLAGPKGETGMIPIKHSFKAGAMGEYATFAKDVGTVKSIKLAEPFSKGSSWQPTSVEVNRLGPSSATGTASRPDGWVKFDVNRPIKDPVTILARGGAVTKVAGAL